MHCYRDVTNRPLADPGQLLLYVYGPPPCQALSSAGFRKGWNDPRTQLYMHAIQAIERCMPDSFLLENSDNLRFANNGAIAGAIITRLRNAGYNVYDNVINTRDYGLPQIRARLWIIGIHISKHV